MESQENIILSLEARLEMNNLFRLKWSESCAELRLAKSQTWENSGKFCPKAEWPKFQVRMVIEAENKVSYWDKLSKEVFKYYPHAAEFDKL